jgi:hypothetical protein
LVRKGKWWKVRFRLDQEGTEHRPLLCVKVAHVSEGLTATQREVRAREILQREGANSKERFARVVLNEGVTFREQSKIYLQEVITRNRRPIRDTTTIEGALNKWLLPELGDLLLSQIDNLTLKSVARRITAAGNLHAPSKNTFCLPSRFINRSWQPMASRFILGCGTTM